MYCFGKVECQRLDLKESREFLSERKGTVIPCRVTEDRKGAGTSSGESGAKNLEAEIIRSRGESTGG